MNVKNVRSDKARVIIYSEESDGYRVNTYDDILDVNLMDDSCSGFACIGYKAPVIEVYLPEDYAITEDMGKVKIESGKDIKTHNSMGSIEIEEVTGSLDVDASMGSVEIDTLKITEDSNINASMGSVNIKHADDIYVESKTDMGSSNVRDNDRNSKVTLKVHCSMGSINVR